MMRSLNTTDECRKYFYIFNCIRMNKSYINACKTLLSWLKYTRFLLIFLTSSCRLAHHYLLRNTFHSFYNHRLLQQFLFMYLSTFLSLLSTQPCHPTLVDWSASMPPRRRCAPWTKRNGQWCAARMAWTGLSWRTPSRIPSLWALRLQYQFLGSLKEPLAPSLLELGQVISVNL